MICICFGTNDKWTSRLIRWVTKSDVSHTWIEYPSEVLGGLWVVHSSSDGVVAEPQERVCNRYPTYEAYECLIDLSDGFRWARQHIGYTEYDYGVIWNGLLLVLYGLTQWEWLKKIVWRCASKLSCSEFNTGFLQNAGTAKGIEEYDAELTTSGALREFCRSSDDFPFVGS